MSSKKIIPSRKYSPPSSSDFKCQQIDMFQDFLYNTPEQLESLSNSIPFADDKDRITEYYPSATEELVEDALRRISTLQDYGFYKDGDPKLRSSGVAFTISQLREKSRKSGGLAHR